MTLAIASFGEKSPDPWAERLLFMQILNATFLQKIAIPLGSVQIFLSIPVMLTILVFGILSGRLIVRERLLFSFMAMVAIMAATQFLGLYEFSALSVTLLFLFSSLYVFRIKPGLIRNGIELRFYQSLMVFFAVLGIAQFLAQFVIGSDYAFFLDGDALSRFIMQGYNSTNAMSYGSTVYKPNAVFFLEPAMFCQFLAIAILIEITHTKKLWRLGLFIVAIAFTFSGSGLLVLMVLMPVYLIQKRQFAILAVLIAILGTVNIWAPPLGLGGTLARSSEFTHPGTSGYARFISIFPILRDHIVSDPRTLLVGHGAGYSKEFDGQYDYEVHPPGWGKLWIEYGLIGMLAYIAFLLPAIWSTRYSKYISMAFTMIILYDGYILVPLAHGLVLALMAWPSAPAIKKDAI